MEFRPAPTQTTIVLIVNRAERLSYSVNLTKSNAVWGLKRFSNPVRCLKYVNTLLEHNYTAPDGEMMKLLLEDCKRWNAADTPKTVAAERPEPIVVYQCEANYHTPLSAAMEFARLNFDKPREIEWHRVNGDNLDFALVDGVATYTVSYRAGVPLVERAVYVIVRHTSKTVACDAQREHAIPLSPSKMCEYGNVRLAHAAIALFEGKYGVKPNWIKCNGNDYGALAAFQFAEFEFVGKMQEGTFWMGVREDKAA